MKPSPSPLASSDFSAERSRDEIRRRFLAAVASSGDGPPPDLEAYVAACPEPERSQLRAELTALQRNLAGAGTVEAPGPDTPTVDAPPPEPAPEFLGGEAPAAAATREYQAGDPLGTTDFSVARADAPAAPEPAAVPGYDILGVLGRGAMGVVYKARQRGLNRIVALKMILAGGHASERELARFRAEAEAVAQLQHPNIVQIHAIGEADGMPFFALEFVAGESLDKKLRDNPLPAREAARICHLLAAAMDYAHQRGILHRDLKPANVLLGVDGTPKVGDFGLAKRLEEQESGVTRAGTVLGTPSYMPPEQAEGKIDELGPRADVYSLGAILYDLLTGRAPFRGATILDTLEQVRTREPVPPMQLQPNVPRDLDTICLKCLQKDPARRYQSAGDLAADLERFLKGEPILARPIGSVERAWRWCRRNPRAAGLSAAVVLLIVGWAVSSSLLAADLKFQKDEADRLTGVAQAQTLEAEKQTGIAKAQKLEAEKQAGIAEAQKLEAEKQTGIAKVQTLIAQKEKLEAERQHQIAEGQTVVALKSEKAARNTADVTLRGMIGMGEMLYKSLQPKSRTAIADAEARRQREAVLATLRASLKDVSAKIDQAGSTVFGEAGASVGFGDLLVKLGQSEEAQRYYERALASLQKTADAKPNNDLARGNLGVALERLGKVALNMKGDGAAARDYYEKARALHQEIFDHPRDGSLLAAQLFRDKQMGLRAMLSHDHHHLGEAYLALGDPAKAREHFQIALEHRKAWFDAEPKSLEARGYLMQAQMSVGAAASFLADDQAALKHFADALEGGNWLLKQAPQYAPFKLDLAKVQGARGDAVFRMNKTEDALRTYQEALANAASYFEKKPDDLVELPALAQLHERIGAVQEELDNEAEAQKSYQAAFKLREELLLIESNSLPRKAAYVLALARFGKHGLAAANAEKLRPQLARSTELMLQMARCSAVCAIHDEPNKAKHLALAVKDVRSAVTKDFKNLVLLQTDPDLAPLRDEPAFQAIVKEVRERTKN